MRQLNRFLVRVRNPGLVAGKECRAQLHRACSQRQRSSDAAAIHDSARSDDGKANRVNNLRNQRNRADHCGAKIAAERSAMAAGFTPLRDHCIHAGLLERDGFVNRGCRAHREHAALTNGRDCVRGKNSKCEAERGRSAFQCHGELLAKRVAGRFRLRRRVETEFSVIPAESFDGRFRRDARVRGQLWREEINTEGTRCFCANGSARFHDLLRSEVRTADEAERSRVTDRGDEIRCIAAPRHGCLNDGVIEKTLQQILSGAHARTP